MQTLFIAWEQNGNFGINKITYRPPLNTTATLDGCSFHIRFQGKLLVVTHTMVENDRDRKLEDTIENAQKMLKLHTNELKYYQNELKDFHSARTLLVHTFPDDELQAYVNRLRELTGLIKYHQDGINSFVGDQDYEYEVITRQTEVQIYANQFSSPLNGFQLRWYHCSTVATKLPDVKSEVTLEKIQMCCRLTDIADRKRFSDEDDYDVNSIYYPY
jgi:hypothetical protein